MTLTTIKELLATVSRTEAETFSLEVYSTSGRKFNIVDAYVDEGVFCIDIEEDPNAA